MEKNKSAVALPTEQREIIVKQINDQVSKYTSNKTLANFEKAYLTAESIRTLKELITPEFMAPIMELQGSKLGFKTDKDRNRDGSPGPGYPIEVVKNCVIEALLMGLEISGNQFNIIAGNTYATKEGLGHLLSPSMMPGLKYTLITALPRINAEKTSASVAVTLKWTFNNETCTETIEVPIKVDQWTSVDAVIGKAKRKARYWLYEKLTGTEMPEGEIEDTTATVVDTKIKKSKEEHESERMQKLVDSCETMDELDLTQKANPDIPAELIEIQRQKIGGKK
jgi:hypothetical protein